MVFVEQVHAVITIQTLSISLFIPFNDGNRFCLFDSYGDTVHAQTLKLFYSVKLANAGRYLNFPTSFLVYSVQAHL